MTYLSSSAYVDEGHQVQGGTTYSIAESKPEPPAEDRACDGTSLIRKVLDTLTQLTERQLLPLNRQSLRDGDRLRLVVGDVWSTGGSGEPGNSSSEGTAVCLLMRLRDSELSQPAQPDGTTRQLISSLIKLAGFDPDTCPSNQGGKRLGGLPNGALMRVTRYIQEHIAERVYIKDLATLAGYSESAFIRAFRTSMGVPPHRYISQQRVTTAAALIRDTDRPLIDIALDVGFADQSHLCRCFMQIMQMTPRAYRRCFR